MMRCAGEDFPNREISSTFKLFVRFFFSLVKLRQKTNFIYKNNYTATYCKQLFFFNSTTKMII